VYMTRRRITTKKELLDFTIEKYAFYSNIFNQEHGDDISKFYLKDFLTDLLLIQRYADGNGEERSEGSTGVS
jgi:hypothetical protein